MPAVKDIAQDCIQVAWAFSEGKAQRVERQAASSPEGRWENQPALADTGAELADQASQLGSAGLPGVATISRWLKRWGMAKGRRRRLRGPVVIRRGVRAARHCNDVW